MWAILEYRFRRWVFSKEKWVKTCLFWPVFFWHQAALVLTGISLPTGTQIGKGLYIGHHAGIFLHSDLVMGENCSLSQGVTIGFGGKGEKSGVPTIGDSVYFGPGAKVFGKITIGKGVAVGANAVVIDSVPDGATAVGVPARNILKEEKEKSSS